MGTTTIMTSVPDPDIAPPPAECDVDDVPGLVTAWPTGELKFTAPACREGMTYTYSLKAFQGPARSEVAAVTLMILPSAEKKTIGAVNSSLGVEDVSGPAKQTRSDGLPADTENEAPPKRRRKPSSTEDSKEVTTAAQEIPSRIDFPGTPAGKKKTDAKGKRERTLRR